MLMVAEASAGRAGPLRCSCTDFSHSDIGTSEQDVERAWRPRTNGVEESMKSFGSDQLERRLHKKGFSRRMDFVAQRMADGR